MIKELKAGDETISYFVLRKKEIKVKRKNNEFYLALELGDASGRISGTHWENVQKKYKNIEQGDVLKVKAQVIDYKNKLHLNIEKFRKAEKRDEFDVKELVPKVEEDIDTLTSKLEDIIKSVKNPHLNKLLNSVFQDKRIKEKFFKAPGGKLWHHNYIGGLLEHTLSVTQIAARSAETYPDDVDLDLLLTAGLLHDIGKIDSYKFETWIDFTDEGRLLGHIVIGSQIVKDFIRAFKDFPPELEKRLQHLILSHQGKLEQASPVVPMTLEALLLYYADEMDSKANAFLRIKKKEGARDWSTYVQLMNQYFYFGGAKKE